MDLASPAGPRPVASTDERRERIAERIKSVARLDSGAIGVRFAIGAPLTLIGPFLLASVFYATCWRFGVKLPIGFGLTFVLFCFAVVPALMRLERHTHGDYYTRSAHGLTKPGEISSRGEWELNQTIAGWHAWVEVALTGPRLLWEAVDQLRGRREMGDADARLAADVVTALLAAGQGVMIRDLAAASPDRPPGELRRAIGLLKHLDLADTSADGKRVWLRGDAAKRLA